MRLARHFSVLLTIAALALLTGCGSQGTPLPPSLNLPKPVSDLKAARKGDKVLLTWTAPRETTDKVRLKQAGTTRLCRASAAPAAMDCSEVGEGAAPSAPDTPASFVDVLPQELQRQAPAGSAVYTVEVMNARSRSAGPSNAVRVPLAPTLPPPDKVLTKVTPEGPVISWVVPTGQGGESLLLPEAMKAKQPVAYSYRLYRREKDRPASPGVTVPTENALPLPISLSPTSTFGTLARSGRRVMCTG